MMTEDDRITRDMIRAAAAGYERSQGRPADAERIEGGRADWAPIVRMMQLMWFPDFDLGARAPV